MAEALLDEAAGAVGTVKVENPLAPDVTPEPVPYDYIPAGCDAAKALASRSTITRLVGNGRVRAVHVGQPVGDLPVEQDLPARPDGARAVRGLADVEGDFRSVAFDDLHKSSFSALSPPWERKAPPFEGNATIIHHILRFVKGSPLYFEKNFLVRYYILWS